MLKASVALLVVGLVFQASAAPTLDSSILRSLQTKKTTTIILSMAETGTTEKVLAQINTRTYSTLADKRVAIGAALKSQAETSQKDLLAFLAKETSARVTQLWITNQVIIRGADSEIVEKLMARKDISSIEEEKFIPLDQPLDLKAGDNGRAGEQWGVINIQAPEVWASGNRGKGVVVANIDTGVRGTHEALRNNFRSERGWFDPSGRTTTPNDQGGHGTHTMGTIAGQTKGVGVAPDAQWIACKGCSSTSCSSADLTECGQWVACPTNPQGGQADCTKAPRLVSNSWGGGNGDDWYETVIKVWRDAGIIPLFSIGNAGPYCGSANSPGDSENVIGVGSLTDANALSSFSSVGPTYRGNRIKPDISAPGSNVFSAYNTGDAIYATMSGTSMACPHAAGLTALLLAENPNMTYDQVKAALESGTNRDVTSTGRNCGNINESVYPNHHSGYGRVNAVKTINNAKEL